MKLIPLTQGKFAKVDDADYEWLMQWKWRFHMKSNKPGEGYASRSIGGVNHRSTVRMHRLIAQTPDGMQVDHIDGDKLNNQRNNLRNCTNAQNARNGTIGPNNTSGYKGIRLRWDKKKWQAEIKIGPKMKYLGSFSTKEEAACAYDKAAQKYYGEFARLNFPLASGEN